jgi:ferrous iron transport protein B
VVATLNDLYNSDNSANDEIDYEKDTIFGTISASFKEAFATIPKNLIEIKNALVDPLGITSTDTTNLEDVRENSEVNNATLNIMRNKFDGKIGAFTYLIFVLLYAPCIVALAAMGSELNKFWMCIAIFWTTFSAYFISVLFYQTATLHRHPLYSISWIIFSLFIFSFVIILLKKLGNKYSFEEIQNKVQSSRCFCKKCNNKCNNGR